VDDVDRGTVEAGQPLGQMRARGDFDLVRKPPDHLAEGPDLVVAVAAGNHQVGGMPQGPLAALGRTSRDGLVEIPEKRIVFSHFGNLKSRQNARTCAIRV